MCYNIAFLFVVVAVKLSFPYAVAIFLADTSAPVLIRFLSRSLRASSSLSSIFQVFFTWTDEFKSNNTIDDIHAADCTNCRARAASDYIQHIYNKLGELLMRTAASHMQLLMENHWNWASRVTIVHHFLCVIKIFMHRAIERDTKYIS